MLWIPDAVEKLKNINYTLGACALGCCDNEDYERVGCCSNGITHICCQDCICYMEHEKKLQAYLKGLGGYDTANKIPELKPGDVFQDNNGRWIMVVTPDEGYSLTPNDGACLCAQCKLENYTPVKIYRRCDERLFAVESLGRIVAGEGAYTPFWEASKTPVEMTVNEVSAKLGYPVKIVGEKNA